MIYELYEFERVASHNELPPQAVVAIGECVDSAFGGRVTKDDALEHMSGDQILIAADKDQGFEHIHAFSATKIVAPNSYFNDDSLSSEVGGYFAAAAVRKESQSHGLYLELNGRRLDYVLKNGAKHVFTRTQNPRVEEGITHSIDVLVANGTITGYDVGRVVLRGVYGKMLTATRPTSRHLSYDEIDYENGDAVMVTWRFK